MATRSDFLEGDIVKHISGEIGIVTSIDGNAVSVTYERLGQNTGRQWIGKYDDNWFRVHPGGLAHQ